MTWSYPIDRVLQTSVGRCSSCCSQTIGILVQQRTTPTHREWLVAEWDGRRQLYVPHRCAVPEAA